MLFRSPRDAYKLLDFSCCIAGWVPKGEWKIFQIDNSSSFLDPIRTSLIQSLLNFSPDNNIDFLKNRTFLFEFNGNEEANGNTELQIAFLIFAFLLFEEHGYVVSSGSSAGQVLILQDGFAYFQSQDKVVSGAKSVLNDFERHVQPDWILKLIANSQDKYIESHEK